MTKANIILTGFMGTGKSTVGRLLAEQTGRTFFDTDEAIVARTGRSIASIFSEDGEKAFRQLEREVARELAGQANLVIATGGRLMLDPLNAVLLGRNAWVFCLTAEPAVILTRLASTEIRRPLLEVPDPEAEMAQLLAERAAGYAQFHSIDTTGRLASEVASEIAATLLQKVNSRKFQQLTAQIPVRYPGGQYPVFVGHDLLERLTELIPLPGPLAVISDANVAPRHASKLAGINPLAQIVIPAGEAHKNLITVNDLYPRLIRAGADRQTTILAFGGGVVGDLAGFVAATYLRGVPFIQCPTTVLAMVDASVGGKTGVDLPEGKNLVGAFKQPLGVVADLDTLTTLPPVELAAGLAEVVKHGLLSAPSLLDQLELAVNTSFANSTDPMSHIPDLLALLVEAILVKRDVVEADPFESGRRKVLNLGHTFGHAIEQVSGYRIRHGQAVAIGLVAAVHLSASLGHLDPAFQPRLEALLTGLSLPTRIPADLKPAALRQAMTSDKKMAAGRLQFVLLKGVGEPFIAVDVPDQAVLHTLTELNQG